MKNFIIEDREIGNGHQPFIIAEVGINHGGNYSKAIQMIDAAVDAGADCVKFQCHITEAEMIPTDITPGGISDEKLWDIIKRCELTKEEEHKLKSYCESKGTIYLCTPFSKEAADRLNAMGVSAFKIGSGECNNLPLLDYIAQFGKPIILSTGMNDLTSISQSVEVIKRHNTSLMLMHCTSLYPTPYDKLRLGAIAELRQTFGLPVGLSDHSLGIYTCLGAIALGACALEKHFTISHDWPGPDISLSIEPQELKELVVGSKAVFQALGGKKHILPEEQPVIDFAYATVVTTKPVKAGEKFTTDNTWVKRPGTGEIPAADLEKILGKKALSDLPAGIHVKTGDVNGY